MKVMINNQVYDSKTTPIMVIFDDFNKADISMMEDDEYMYFEVPDNFTDEQVERFLKENYDSNWKVRVAE